MAALRPSSSRDTGTDRAALCGFAARHRAMKPNAAHTCAALCALMLSLQATGAAAQTTIDKERYLRRLETALLLQTLNADLLSHDSATSTLQRWCDVHHLASPASITAERVRGTEKSPTQIQRERLRVAPTDRVAYRRVRLRCGTVVLSEADNWY